MLTSDFSNVVKYVCLERSILFIFLKNLNLHLPQIFVIQYKSRLNIDVLCGIFKSAPFGGHKQMHKYKRPP